MVYPCFFSIPYGYMRIATLSYFCIIIFLIFSKISIETDINTSRYHDTMAQIAQLYEKNMWLREQLYTNMSYIHIASEAAKMGFIRRREVILVK